MTMSTPSKNSRTKAVGIIGLGIMGSAIANHLVTAGYRTYGYDPDEVCQKNARSNGVITKDNASAVAKHSNFILMSLPNAQALDDTITQMLDNPNALALEPILIDLSTLNLKCKTYNYDRLAKDGIALFDCPISGTGAQAKTGDIAIYASGPANIYNSLTPIFDCFACDVFYIGEFGQGTKMKIAANLLVAIHNVATAEALLLAINSGLDTDMFCKVISAGAGSSRIFELRGPLMAKETFTPPTMKLSVWEKDMAMIEQFANKMGSPTPLFSATSPIYEAALRNGLGEQDTAAVFTVLQNIAEHSQPLTNN